MFGFSPLASDTADSDIPGWRHAATIEALNETSWRLRVRRAGSSTEIKVSMCPPRSEADTSILQLPSRLKMSWPDAYGSRDIGLMQHNSSWLPTLAGHGIAEHNLFDACTSIHVGAWILAGNVSRLGYTWEAVGAYDGLLPRPAHAQRHPEKGCAIARHCAGGRIIPTQSPREPAIPR